MVLGIKMKIIFLGDSITQGIGVNDPQDAYVELVRRTLSCQIVNAGMGSTRIARSRTAWAEPHWHTLDFNARAQVLPPDCDFCIVFGGTNDYGDGDNPIGHEEDTGFDTFTGALQHLTDTLIARYGKEKLLFVIPCRRYREEAHPASYSDVMVEPFVHFVDRMIAVLEKKQIPYLDLYHDPAMPRPLTTDNQGCFRDGLHPNECGHRHIAERILAYLHTVRPELPDRIES